MPRHVLQDGWQIARDEGVCGADLGWHTLDSPQPLAAFLAARGEWSTEHLARDLDAESWTWRVGFDRPDGLGPDAILGLDGLATICEVSLNGEPLLASDNMFLAHRLSVGDRLQARGNELRIRALPLAARWAQRRSRPRWRVPMLPQQQLRWWRTTLLGRTPGWSPSAPAVGPWRDVWLGDASSTLAERLRLRTRVDGRAGWLDVLLVDAPPGALHLQLHRDGQIHRLPLARDANGTAAGTLRIDDVALWWPHTHGEPALYDAELILGDGPESRSIALHAVGFRELHWHRENGDFALEVNGVPVFARGACWTPLDPLRLHAAPDRYAPAIEQVKAAGMNLLRVNGCMVYEVDAFHDACDRAGVMVWQDFMLANMDYPAEDETWLGSLRVEVGQQLMRWQARPSLALLCGNSEVEQQAAMLGAPRELWSPPLFHDTLPRWCADVLPDAPYWPSSSHGGALPFSPESGTASYYGVGAYQRPLDDARSSRLRFASECLAFAQIPEPAALDRMPGGRSLRTHHPRWKQAAPRDLGAGWDFEDVRDHYLERVFGVDPTALRRHDVGRYLMLSRAVVSHVVESSFAQWRSASSTCRGALVWTLRDLQPGAGWGYLDDQGAPKSAWYALRRALQPVTVLMTDEGLNGLHLQLVNETAQAVDATLELAVFRGEHALARAHVAHRLKPRHVEAVAVQSLLDHFIDLTWAYRFGPPAADLVQATLCDTSGCVLGRAQHRCGSWATEVREDLGLQADLQRVDAKTLALSLSTRRPAAALQIELPGHEPEDAYFDLGPGEQRLVQLHATGPAPRQLRGSVQAANAAWPVAIHTTAAGSP